MNIQRTMQNPYRRKERDKADNGNSKIYLTIHDHCLSINV